MRFTYQRMKLFFAITLCNVLSSFALLDTDNINSTDATDTFELVTIDSLLQVQKTRDSIKADQLITLHEAALKKKTSDSNSVFKSLAVLYSKKEDSKKASDYIVKYMRSTQDLSILNDHIFSDIKESNEYKGLKDSYKAKLGFLPIIYAFTGIFGFFIFIFLNSKRNLDKVAVILISLFVLFHSLFILHLSLYVSKYNLLVPHSLYASTPFSFLYGPLLYFYFKRVVENYKFSWRDALHLIPSLGLFFYLLPYYNLSAFDKFQIMFDQAKFVLPGTIAIIIIKIASLATYAWATFNLYNRQYKDLDIANKKGLGADVGIVWQRNVLTIFVSYVVAYILYASAVTKIINYPPFLNLQIIVMVVMVFYVSAISFLQPEVFKGNIKLDDISKLFKYSKSGLTDSYSSELKENLLMLMNEKKVFKLNDINLDSLSEMLGTTRHNTSQVINEHFGMSFYDLINNYRINEAKAIFQEDKNGLYNIIDVAYEVGYNNKVTFNKAFKKQLELTPSEFIKSVRATASST